MKQTKVTILSLILILISTVAFALNVVQFQHGYYPDPTKGRPVSSGSIYVGIVDLDPEIVGNQKQVSIQQENGDIVEVSQPISTSAGGVPQYNGSSVTLLVDGAYSLKVLNSGGSQVYYMPSNEEPESDIKIASFPGNTIPGTTDMTVEFQALVDEVGNTKTIVITELLAIGHIDLPAGGGTIRGSTSNSYFVNDGRNRYHIQCNLGADPTNTMLWGPAANGKGTWTIRDLNVDMDGSTSTAIQNEDKGVLSGSVRFNVRNVTIDNCGKDGIVIQNGGNTSRIEDSYISGPDDFLDGTGEFDKSKYVTDSNGIYILASDCVVRDNEVKGGFWYGLHMNSGNNIVTDNFLDQNKFGLYNEFGEYNKYLGNRLHYNWGGGGIIEGSRVTFIGNTVTKNNSTRVGATSVQGSYDGYGLLMTDTRNSTFNGNTFGVQLDGFVFTLVHASTFVGNNEYDLDGVLYDYSNNLAVGGNDWENRGWDFIIGNFYLFNNELKASMEAGFNGHEFHTPAIFDMGIIKKRFLDTLTADYELQTTDGTYLHMTPDQAGWTISLDSDFSFTRNAGMELTVLNASGTFTFTFDTTVIPVNTAYQFVIIGGGSAFRVE